MFPHTRLLALILFWLKNLIENTSRIVPIILWKLWCLRNIFVLEGIMQLVEAIRVQALSLLHHVSLAFGSNRIEHMQPTEKIVSWSRPLKGITALNVDGSVFSNVGVGGFRGLVCDHSGDFLHGYYGSSGGSCIIHAGILAFFHGVQLCWDLGY
jgi:hypothetical protein